MSHRELALVAIQEPVRLKVAVGLAKRRFEVPGLEDRKIADALDHHLRLEDPTIGGRAPLLWFGSSVHEEDAEIKSTSRGELWLDRDLGLEGAVDDIGETALSTSDSSQPRLGR